MSMVDIHWFPQGEMITAWKVSGIENTQLILEASEGIP